MLMRAIPYLLTAMCLCSIGCSQSPVPTEATPGSPDTVSVSLDKAKQDIEESGKELDKLINDL